MGTQAITINELGKVYKLYRRPRDKIIDAFGLDRLLLWRKSDHQEFWALRGLNLTVGRGERLGIIGRNGAGKSTLLKIITGNIAPSEGRVTVQGRVQALLELGTGFHPEFTGRENIRASLAYHGLPSRVLAEKEEEIIEFAELEEFIDQPVKTYSAGMYARLAFSTATAIEPEVLIIDEVLGAGDAYFSAKCVERMRSLTEGSGATVLFVSHDLGSVQQLCRRVIWIDRGRIVMDGEPLEVTKAYYASILAQEERRLRARNARLARSDAGRLQEREQAGDVKELLFRLVTDHGGPPGESHPIGRLTLKQGGRVLAEVLPGAPMDNNPAEAAYLLTDPRYMLWREPENVAGRWIRCFAATGGKYVHAPFVMQLPREVWQAGGLELEIEHAAVPGDVVRAELFDGQAYQPLGVLTPDVSGWRTDRWSVPGPCVEGPSTERPAASVAEQPEEAPSPSEASSRAPESPPADPQAAPETPADLDPAAARGPADVVLRRRTGDRFYSDWAEIVEARICDSDGVPRAVFGLGQSIHVHVEADVRVAIATCEFTFALYTTTNTVVAAAYWPIRGGLRPGRWAWAFSIEQPNLRQEEYLLSLALIRQYCPATNEAHEFYSLWNRSLSFRVDEGRLGKTPLGLVRLDLSPPPDGLIVTPSPVGELPRQPGGRGTILRNGGEGTAAGLVSRGEVRPSGSR